MTDTPTRRRLRWLLPALVVLAWLALGAFSGPFAGKLSSVVITDDAAFLPASAEATRVTELQRTFSTEDVTPAIVIAARDGGLETDDLAYLEDVAAQVRDLPQLSGDPSPPIPSEDGEAAQLIVPLDADDEPDTGVEKLRELLAEDVPDGLTVLVTGQAAQAADLSEAFAGIDGILLLVAAGVVALILVLVYRSPILPVAVLLSGVFALGVASLAVYLLADAGTLDLNGQSQGILFILVFGAATDYALLLVARFREELRRTEDRYRALAAAWRGTVEPILASAGTVVLGVLCLLFSDLNSNRSLGPVAAIGIAASVLASITFLPAVLALLGRAAFWPRRPKTTEDSTAPGLWGRVARLVGRRPRAVWVLTTLALAVGAAFMPQLKADGVAPSDFFLTRVDSVDGADLLAEHFPAGAGAPTVVIADADHAEEVVAAARVDGVEDAGVALNRQTGEPVIADGLARIDVVLTDPVDSEAALETVQRIRDAVHAVPGADALVGGPSAIQLDTQLTSERDRDVIIPIVLLVVFLVLAVLLRAIVAPLLLIATVVLSFAATLGVSALLFNHVFGFVGADPVVPLFGFVFLVALGIDYNIFLMTRVREEAATLGTREGTLRGLTVTGGVITSAGVVLAATFSALAVIPLLFLAQLAFIVAFGVLLDTLVVRSLLVPALTLDVGRKVWWPSRLARRADLAHGRRRGLREATRRQPGPPARPVLGAVPGRHPQRDRVARHHARPGHPVSQTFRVGTGTGVGRGLEPHVHTPPDPAGTVLGPGVHQQVREDQQVTAPHRQQHRGGEPRPVRRRPVHPLRIVVGSHRSPRGVGVDQPPAVGARHHRHTAAVHGSVGQRQPHLDEVPQHPLDTGAVELGVLVPREPVEVPGDVRAQVRVPLVCDLVSQ
ncbi:RND superfamily putative drug exporter [Stackebrandtia albiflava]|uniref:RND superfamily putative drug exporter n=1 Tax=Stackebrandtia albiflava TaxID=406432 RepID=A0A562V9N4_9ACTN|nr:MMPL family transporter [Stackebrandtia albiflava]TWJ14596.1 RND superfamily putative drug exporter [Stackebrandtia albiflava]